MLELGGLLPKLYVTKGARDTQALGAGQARRAGGCWARGRWASVCAGRRRAGRGGGTARARARGVRRAGHGAALQQVGLPGRGLCTPGRAAGPAGCALGALSLFLTPFNSVLFMSQFLDIVREPGS